MVWYIVFGHVGCECHEQHPVTSPCGEVKNGTQVMFEGHRTARLSSVAHPVLAGAMGRDVTVLRQNILYVDRKIPERVGQGEGSRSVVGGQSVDDLVPRIMRVVLSEYFRRSVVRSSFVETVIDDHQSKASFAEGRILQPAIP